MIKIYDKLIDDCNTLQDRAGDGDIKGALSNILKDQIGMNASLEVLKRILSKYRKWEEAVSGLPEEYIEFQEKGQKDVEALTYYVTKKISDIRF